MQLRQCWRIDLQPGTGLDRQDHIKAAVAEVVVLSARRPAAGARTRNCIHHESESCRLLLVRVRGAIAECDARLRQNLKDPPRRASGGTEFEHPQWPIVRPRRGNLTY